MTHQIHTPDTGCNTPDSARGSYYREVARLASSENGTREAIEMDMKIKTPAKVDGIPACSVAVSPGVTDQGMAQVMVVISAIDALGMPTVVASLRMTAKEATVFAARVVDNANQATLMSASAVRP